MTNEGVLTIGETDEFLGDGGIISFFLEDKKIRFAIQLTHAKEAGLQLSSKLLSLAKVEE